MPPKIQNSYSDEKVPTIASITTRWKPAELRSGIALMEAIVQLKGVGIVDAQTGLEAISFFFNWSKDDIAQIIERLGAEKVQALFSTATQIPGLGLQ